jgi:hypothetical protein
VKINFHNGKVYENSLQKRKMAKSIKHEATACVGKINFEFCKVYDIL